ncbi:hypothetical protein L6Q96_14810 [Candidatus Binatia bacterium]|nr:hypothetical protein [Candidatus Binatia bacterium]
MLTPEPMLHLSIMVLDRDLEAATRAVATAGVLHLLDVRHSIHAPSAVRPYDVAERVAHLEGLSRTLRQATAFVGAVRFDSDESEAPPDDTVAASEVDARVTTLAAEIDALREKMAAVNADIERLTTRQRHLRALAPVGVALETLRNLRYVTLVSGLLPQRNLPRLRESLATIPHLLIPSSAPGRDGRLLISAVCLQPSKDVLDRALRGAQLERVEVPADLDGTPDDLLGEVTDGIDARHAELDRLETERRALGMKRRVELRALATRVERERLFLEARGKMGRSERTALLAGWVPARLASRLEAAVRNGTQDRCVLQWSAPEALTAVRRGMVGVPILLRNPWLIRPFEHLLRNYGLPQYDEIEPTTILAATFLLMFGFMFGDVGQGAVLFAVGYFLYRRPAGYRDYAVMLMECGVSAIVFGFLYGSVFGVEHWLPALWLRPMEDMPALIRAAVIFGALLLSLGFLLNLFNAWRRRDLRALLERNGLFAAVAYWTAIGLLLRRLIGGPDAVTLGTALIWVSVPLAAIFLKDPAAAVWRARREGKRLDFNEVFASLVQAAVEVLDTFISSVSNTATFIRLAAFALSHAGLFLAVFSLADVVGQSGAGSAGAALVLVIGNLLIIVLEGLIVAIQSVRLEYFEFFSKFYGGGGEEYRPLRIAAVPPGPSRATSWRVRRMVRRISECGLRIADEGFMSSAIRIPQSAMGCGRSPR